MGAPIDPSLMAWYHRLLSSRVPEDAVSRRRFFGGAGALAAGTLLAGDARAESNQTTPDPLGLGVPTFGGRQQVSPFVGEIAIFAGNFPPRSWAFCDGQLLPIAQNTALFSLLGTIYGGDGRTTFALPDLRSRVPIQAGQGPGLRNWTLGQRGGTERTPETPAHTHTAVESEIRGTGPQVAGAVTGGDRGTDTSQSAGTPPGNGNHQPYQVVNYIIALSGVYPSRS